MKKLLQGEVALVSIMLISAGLSANVFATENYGITYTGGEPLGESNVTIDPDLVDGLTPILANVIHEDNQYSNSAKWEDGYYLNANGLCRAVKFFRVTDTTTITPNDNLKVSVSNDQYIMDISYEEASVENYVNDGKAFAVTMTGNWIVGMARIYTDAECQNQSEDIKTNGPAQGSRLFVKTKITLYKKGQDSAFTSDKLYFGTMDIDAAQSFKILNPNNLMAKSNMFARSATDLQDKRDGAVLKNMFAGDYIYSEYDVNGSPYTTVASDNESNIYVKIDQEVQRSGLEMVFGYGREAAAQATYYAQQYTVQYQSDARGEITGIVSEEVISGENPSTSTESPKDGYELEHWIADKDVTLTDGTIIKAGEPLTNDQIKFVVVTEDLVFTAIHKTKPATEPAVPDTGASTKNIEPATVVSASVIGTLLCALIVRTLPRITRRKVKFDK